MHRIQLFIIVFLFFSSLSGLSAIKAGEPENLIRVHKNLALVIKDEKHSLIDGEGKSLLPGWYEYIMVVEGESAIIYDKGKWAYVAVLDGRQPSFDYDFISGFQEGLAMVMLYRKWGYIDRKGKLVIPMHYESTALFSESLAGVKDPSKRKYGFIDNTGEVVIPFNYDYVWSFKEGVARVVREGKYGVIDRKGKIVIETKYDEIRDEYEGMFEVVMDGKVGVLTKEGKELIAADYDRISWPYSDKIFHIRNEEGKSGMIEADGREIIPAIYNYTSYFNSYGVAEVWNGNGHGYINRQGKEVIIPQYDRIEYMNSNTIAVKLGDKYGILDSVGKCIIPPEYDFVRSVNGDDWIPLSQENGDVLQILRKRIGELPGEEVIVISGLDYGMLNKEGKQITPMKYDHMEYFREGRAKVGLDEKFGYIDTTGREVIPMKYDFVSDFEGGVARVRIEGKYGVIDKEGHEVLSPHYDHIYKFEEGFAITKLGEKYGVINKEGIELRIPRYDNVYEFKNGIAITRMGEKYGFIVNHTFQEIEPKYDKAYSGYTGYDEKIHSYMYKWRQVTLNGKINYVDTLGVEVFPFNYEDIQAIHPFSTKLFLVKTDGKFGLIKLIQETNNVVSTYRWEEIIPVENQSLFHVGNLVFMVKRDKHTRIWNIALNEYVDTPYENIWRFDTSDKNPSFFQIKKKEKYGAVDRWGKEILPPVYGNVRYSLKEPGIFRILAKLNNDLGIADTLGNVILPPIYDWIEGKDSLYILSKNKKKGLANKEGKILIKPTYEWMHIVSPDRILVKYELNKYGLVDFSGNSLLEYNCKNISHIGKDTLLVTYQNSRYSGAVDYEGNELIRYYEKLTHENGKTHIKVKYGSSYFSDDKGNLVGPCWDYPVTHTYSFNKEEKYNNTLPKLYQLNAWSQENMQVIRIGYDKYGIFEFESSRFLSPLKYDMLTVGGKMNFASVGRKGGYISAFGDEIIPLRYKTKTIFREGIAAVCEDDSDEVRFITEEGVEAFPLKVEDVKGSMSHGIMVVKLDDKWGAIDKTGEVVISCKYDYLDSFDSNVVAVFGIGDKYGVLSIYGNEVVPPIYDELKIESKVILCKSGEKYGFLSRIGEMLIEPQYEEVTPIKIYSNENVRWDRQTDWLYVTHKDGKYGVVNAVGMETIVPKYSSRPEQPRGYGSNLYSGSEGFLIVGDYRYVITREGREVDLSEYRINSIREDMNDKLPFFIASKGMDWCIVDYEGNVSAFDSLRGWEWKDNMCKVEAHEPIEENRYMPLRKYGYVNSKGKIIVPPVYEYDDIEFNKETRCFEVKANDKVGLIYEDGTVIAETEYDEIYRPFLGGFAVLKKDKRYTFVDRYGNKFDTYSQLKKGVLKK